LLFDEADNVGHHELAEGSPVAEALQHVTDVPLLHVPPKRLLGHAEKRQKPIDSDGHLGM
jgi:hypothetical protein